MRYRVIFSSRASRELKKIALPARERLSIAADALAADPRPRGCLKMQSSNSYRIRVGEYRLVYEIHDRIVTVLVMAVGHRGDIYR